MVNNEDLVNSVRGAAGLVEEILKLWSGIDGLSKMALRSVLTTERDIGVGVHTGGGDHERGSKRKFEVN